MSNGYQDEVRRTNGLEFLPLFEDRICILMSPQNPLANRESVDIHDMDGCTINLLDYSGFSRNGMVPGLHNGINYHIQPFSVKNVYRSALLGEVTVSTMSHVPYYYPLIGVPLDGATINVFGLAHRPDPDATVQTFLDFAKRRFALAEDS